MGSSYNPLVAPAYTAGTITFAGGSAQSLLTLIKAQLEPNCPGAALMVTVQNDSNSASVFVGAPSALGGALTNTNYGQEVQAGGSIYNNSSGAANAAPLAALQVYSVGSGTIHVQVWS